MANPVTALNTAYRLDTQQVNLPIKNAEALVVGAFVGLKTTTGFLEFMKDAASLTSVGIVKQSADGDNTHLTGDGTFRAICEGNIILEKVSVVGVASAANVGTLVYATDGQTLTLTVPSTGGTAVGRVIRWHTGTTCDILLYSMEQAYASIDLT